MKTGHRSCVVPRFLALKNRHCTPCLPCHCHKGKYIEGLPFCRMQILRQPQESIFSLRSRQGCRFLASKSEPNSIKTLGFTTSEASYVSRQEIIWVKKIQRWMLPMKTCPLSAANSRNSPEDWKSRLGPADELTVFTFLESRLAPQDGSLHDLVCYNIRPGKNRTIWGKARRITTQARRASTNGATPLKITSRGTSFAIPWTT
jgi:hypothetical protein